MKELQYCPKCGNKTLQFNEINKLSCTDCDFVLYHNCAAAVAVILRCRDEIFFTKRSQEPKSGMLDLSGGFVDPNESAEETCKRELMEELQLPIDVSRLRILGTRPNVYHFKGIDYNTMDIFFEYEVKEKFLPTLELSEVSDGIWVKISNLNFSSLAFDSQRNFLRTWVEPFS